MSRVILLVRDVKRLSSNNQSVMLVEFKTSTKALITTKRVLESGLGFNVFFFKHIHLLPLSTPM